MEKLHKRNTKPFSLFISRNNSTTRRQPSTWNSLALKPTCQCLCVQKYNVILKWFDIFKNVTNTTQNFRFLILSKKEKKTELAIECTHSSHVFILFFFDIVTGKLLLHITLFLYFILTFSTKTLFQLVAVGSTRFWNVSHV